MVNSGPFDGLPSDQGMQAITDHVEQSGWGKRAVSYRLRDWLISRQRYWGTPIPMVHCPSCGTVPVPENQLPVLLPSDAEFKPTGESPLGKQPRASSRPPAPSVAETPSGRPTPWTPSSIRPGT